MRRSEPRMSVTVLLLRRTVSNKLEIGTNHYTHRAFEAVKP